MSDLQGKTAAELRAMLATVESESARRVQEVREIMKDPDMSAKGIDRMTRLQTQSDLIWVRTENLKRALRVAEYNELEAELERLSDEIPKLQAAHAEELERTYAAAYELLRFRDEAAHEWHERRKHEIRLIATKAHGPGAIEARLHDAKLKLKQAEDQLNGLDRAEA